MLKHFLDKAPADFHEAELGFYTEGIARYLRGWFPMYDSDSDEVQWVQGHARAIVPLDERFTVARSLRARVRRAEFEIASDECLVRVMQECARPTPQRPETWLHEEIVVLFDLYRRAGLAHSVEAWKTSASGERVLVGGLYGVALGAVFCGESMFSRPELGGTDASKVCLVHLVGHLRRRGFRLLDAQLSNEHMAQFGTYDIGGAEYVKTLRKLANEDVSWPPFEPDVTRQAR